METPAWSIQCGEGPLVAAAIHNGHDVRPEVAPLLAILPADRLREEDPYTASWTAMAPTRIIGNRSRFEVDLNRPRESSVYLQPDDAWGLEVWREALPPAILDRSYRMYDLFYGEVAAMVGGLVERHGRVVVFDLHSYNHRRGGPRAVPDAAGANPTINLGTSNMDLDRWRPVVERVEQSMQLAVLGGRPLDVRCNVRFQGGHFVRWLHRTFPNSVCALAVEVKKVFMNEWTGELDVAAHAAIGRALAAAGMAVWGLLSEGGH